MKPCCFINIESAPGPSPVPLEISCFFFSHIQAHTHTKWCVGSCECVCFFVVIVLPKCRSSYMVSISLLLSVGCRESVSLKGNQPASQPASQLASQSVSQTKSKTFLVASSRGNFHLESSACGRRLFMLIFVFFFFGFSVRFAEGAINDELICSFLTGSIRGGLGNASCTRLHKDKYVHIKSFE